MSTSRLRSRWLLPASLALNVFLCVAWLVHLPQDWSRLQHRPPTSDEILDQMTRDLPPDDAKLLRNSLLPGLNEVEKAHEVEKNLSQRLQDILGREPFDKGAFRNMLAQSLHAREVLDGILPDALEKLSPEGRRRLRIPPGPPPEPPPPSR